MKTNRKIYPLRKVMDWYYSDEKGQMEILECGHHVHRLSDIYGPTNASRRRCRKCWEEKKKAPGPGSG